MRKDVGGHGGLIINIASVSAFRPYFLIPVYAGTKHAILGFTRSLANDAFFSKTGIYFITICPGATRTNFYKSIFDSFLFPEMTLEIKSDIENYSVQPPSKVAECIMKAIEDKENGAVWQVENSCIRKINPHVYPTF